MRKTIPLAELPRKAEWVLQTVGEEHESVGVERNGEPSAAPVPMDEFRRWHPETTKADVKSR